jgi:hypothetical protein
MTLYPHLIARSPHGTPEPRSCRLPLKTGPHALRRQIRVNQRKKRTARIRNNYCMLLRSRSTSACHLYRLASHARRDHGGRPVLPGVVALMTLSAQAQGLIAAS